MTPRLRLNSPSRLHFGLLAWGEVHPRQFGSVGLMVEDPGLVAEVGPADDWSAEGPLAPRALAMMRRVADALAAEGRSPGPLRLTLHRAPPEHVGLGTGTQLSLAVARLVLAASGEETPTAERLAALTGRGFRSGIGLHGALRGGLLVDGGRSPRSEIPPLLSRLDFPDDWSILVVQPALGPGLAGTREVEAFARLPAVPDRVVDRLCRLVLLGLLPAVVERDLPAFGEALDALQRDVGRLFAPAQGGLFAHPELEAIAGALRCLGVVGVGQSSWGPTLFGFARRDPDRQARVVRDLRVLTDLPPVSAAWTVASVTGSRIEAIPDGPP